MSATAEREQAAAAAGGAGVIDVEALLAPIPGENPAGVSLRYDGTYEEIRAARRADDHLEQGAWKRERKVPDWPRVVALAGDALATRSKDLQVGAWLAEALAQLHGFPGLRDGLRLMRGLQLNFWGTLHPEIDEGSLDARANSLSWLDRQLSLVARSLPLTDGAAAARYSFADWEDSQRFDVPENLDDLDTADLERVNQIRMRAADEGKINSEQWRAARDATGRAFYEATFAALDDCWAEFRALDAATDEMFGDQSPGLPALGRTLEDVRVVVGRIVAGKREAEPDAVTDFAEPGPLEDAGEPPAPGAGAGVSPRATRPREVGAAGSREEAFRKLAEAAAYFRQTEPHSPVSYLVERAIRWGRMPLEEWLAEVVKSDDVLLNLRETLGLARSGGGEPGYAEDGDV